MKYILSILALFICAFFVCFQIDVGDNATKSKDKNKSIENLENSTEYINETSVVDSKNEVSYKDVYDNIDELFMKNETIFRNTAAILSKIDGNVIFGGSIYYSQISIDNNLYKPEEIFNEEDMEVISECFNCMRDYAPSFMGLCLVKFTRIDGVAVIEFMLDGEFDENYVEIGVLYSDSDLTDSYEMLRDNWYKFRHMQV